MSLKDTTVDLGPLTIFVGPNASGKSAIFKALVTVGKLLGPAPVRGPQGEFSFDVEVTFDEAVWMGDAGLPIEFRLWFDDDPDDAPGYTMELRKDARGWGVSRERLLLSSGWFDTRQQVLEYPTERRGVIRWESPNRATLCHLVQPYRNDQQALPVISPFLEFSQRFGQVWRYRPSALDIAAFAQPKAETERQPRRVHVHENGWGLAWVLQQLQGTDRKCFEAIEQELRQIFPHVRFINFQSDARFGVRLAFTTERSQAPVPAPQESDGVLLTTFLLWRLHTANPALKTCLEEPENGTHPYLLGERYKLLRSFADGRSGQPPVQLLVATHSPDFLSAHEKPQEMASSVRIVEFGRESGTKVYRLSDYNQAETLLGVFSGDLGELWWSGALGGVPPPQKVW